MSSLSAPDRAIGVAIAMVIVEALITRSVVTFMWGNESLWIGLGKSKQGPRGEA